MKKFLVLISLLLCLTLTGCGNKTSDDTNEIINQGNTSDEDNNSSDEINLYSTEDRLVYNANDVYYIVVDFGSNDYATGLKWIYNYQDANTAALMVAGIKTSLEADDGIRSVTQDGKYIVIEYEESSYKDMQRSTIDASFSMYEKIENQQ